jgi:hypothetical protein
MVLSYAGGAVLFASWAASLSGSAGPSIRNMVRKNMMEPKSKASQSETRARTPRVSLGALKDLSSLLNDREPIEAFTSELARTRTIRTIEERYLDIFTY